MNHRRKVSIILSLMAIIMLFAMVGTEVSATEKKVTVSYTVKSEYSLKVTVGGGGYLKDGTQSIREGTVEYNLPSGSYKEFEIVPDEGYKLVDLRYAEPQMDPNGSISILDQVKDGKISLQVKNTEMTLTAIFEKIDDGSGTSGGTGSKPSGGSGTSGKPSGQRPFQGTGHGSAGQTSTSSGTGTKTGDYALTEWYLLLMLTAVAALMIITAKKKKNVYKEPESVFYRTQDYCGKQKIRNKRRTET